MYKIKIFLFSLCALHLCTSALIKVIWFRVVKGVSKRREIFINMATKDASPTQNHDDKSLSETDCSQFST